MPLPCPFCKENILEVSKFCPECGKKLQLCASCGVFLFPNSKFCLNCGAPIGAGKSQSQSTSIGDISTLRTEGGDVRIGTSEIKTGGHYVGGNYVEDKSDIATKKGQKCPICKVLVKDDYFQCPRCERDYIHEKHQVSSPDYYKEHKLICEECFESLKSIYKKN